MKVQANHGKVTQNMHGARRNYRYVWDVSTSQAEFMLILEQVNDNKDNFCGDMLPTNN